MWLTVPSVLSACSAAASTDSTAPSTPSLDEWASMSSRSLLWRSKRSEPRVWRRRCSAATWLRGLSGLATSGSSPQPPWLAAWTSSLRASPALPLPQPANVWAAPTTGGSGPRSSGAFAKLGPDGSFWKTFEGSYLSSMEPPSEKFSQTWPVSGSLRSGVCSRRPPLVPLISASGSSSSEVVRWPTPDTAPEAKNAGSNRTTGPKSLGAAATANWPTPTAGDAEAAGGRNTPGSKANPGVSLTEAAQWRTPATVSLGYKAETLSDADGSPARPGRRAYRRRPDGSVVNSSVTLDMQAEMLWGTPMASDRAQEPRDVHHGVQLANQASVFPTPAARDYRAPNSAESQERRGRAEATGQQLPNFVEHYLPTSETSSSMWSTPNARDEKNPGGSTGPRSQRKAEQGWTVDLNDQAAFWATPPGDGLPSSVTGQDQPSDDPPASPQDPPTEPPGPRSSPPRPPSRRQLVLLWIDAWLRPRSVAHFAALSPEEIVRTAGAPPLELQRLLPEVFVRPRLNPEFVSWMMDVPSGWWNFTALTSFAPAETPSSKPKRRKRSGSSGSASSVDPLSALE